MMSGTSLDGLDIALVEFSKSERSKWRFELIAAETYDYSDKVKSKLKQAPGLSGHELSRCDHWFGDLVGELCLDFMEKHSRNVDLVVSHGHTIFHTPSEGISLQIGNPHRIMKHINRALVWDLRSQDLILGGQGAPLVPGGEFDLFPAYDCFINLGGFSNVSYQNRGKIEAFDICPVNIVFNYLAQKLGLTFDEGGSIARSGKANQELIQRLNQLDYYSAASPKSLGREWVEKHIHPLLQVGEIQDLMHSFNIHISHQISKTLQSIKPKKVLLSGGGAKNTFLIENIRNQVSADIDVAEENILNFKEAIVFAFLGLKRSIGAINCYASVTGAARDHCSGLFMIPEKQV